MDDATLETVVRANTKLLMTIIKMLSLGDRFHAAGRDRGIGFRKGEIDRGASCQLSDARRGG